MGVNPELGFETGAIPMRANGAWLAKRAVVASTDGSNGEQRGAPAAAVSQHATFTSVEKFLGIAREAVADGAMGELIVKGRCRAVGGGVITAGDYVIWGATGKFTSFTLDASKFAYLAGIAASDCAGDGSEFDLFLCPILIAPATDSTVNMTLTGILQALTGTFTGAVTVGTTLGVTGDVSAAGGFRQNIGPWVQENVAANQAAVAIGRGASAGVGKTWVAPRAGSLMGLSGFLTTAGAAGSDMIVSVYKNGALLNALTILTFDFGTTSVKETATFAKDAHTFAAGDEITVRVTTDGAWTAVTADLTVDLEVEL